MSSKLVILCGGYGTRLGNLVLNVPKSMLNFDDRPFLEYLLKKVCILPFEEVILLAGHLSSVVANHFDDVVINGVKVTVVSEVGPPKGTLGALSVLIEGVQDENIWIANGDTLFDFELLHSWGEIFSAVDDARNLLFPVWQENTHRFGTLELDGSKVVSFEEKVETSVGGWINSGLIRLRCEVIRQALAEGYTSLENDVLTKLALAGDLFCCCGLLGNFIDIGTLDDYERVGAVIEKMFPTRAIFWDRDGTLNLDGGYTYKPENLVILDHIEASSKAFSVGNVSNFVVSNQSGIGRGFYSTVDFFRFHRELKRVFLLANRRIDDVRFCPHHSDALPGPFRIACGCRKPGIQMFLDLQSFWRLDFDKCRYVGNDEVDKLAAEKLGVRFFDVNSIGDSILTFEDFLDVR